MPRRQTRTSRRKARLTRRARKLGVASYRRRRIGYRNSRGLLKIMRKLPIMTVSSSGNSSSTPPYITLTDPTSTCLKLGTPALSPGFLAGVFDIPFSMTFRLDQLVQSGDITSIADQFKILGAYVRLFYNINTSIGQQSAEGSPVASMPYVQYITDHDDAVAPDIVNFRAKMGLKFKTFKANSGYIGMKVKPLPAMEVYSSGTAYTIPGRAPWINSTDADVPHYSIKGILCQVPIPTDPTTYQTVFTFDVAQKVLAKDFQ